MSTLSPAHPSFGAEPNRQGELTGSGKYTVFCSSQSGFDSYSVYDHELGREFGLAPYAWAYAGGSYNILTGACLPPFADSNDDFIVIYAEIRKPSQSVADWVATQYDIPKQTLCFYSTSMYYSVFYRKNGYPLGDANQDEIISMADVLKIRHYLAGGSLTNDQKKLADMDGDGSVTSKDVLTIRQYIVDINM